MGFGVKAGVKVCVGGCGYDVVCSKVASGGICHVSFVHC